MGTLPLAYCRSFEDGQCFLEPLHLVDAVGVAHEPAEGFAFPVDGLGDSEEFRPHPSTLIGLKVVCKPSVEVGPFVVVIELAIQIPHPLKHTRACFPEDTGLDTVGPRSGVEVSEQDTRADDVLVLALQTGEPQRCEEKVVAVWLIVDGEELVGWARRHDVVVEVAIGTLERADEASAVYFTGAALDGSDEVEIRNHGNTFRCILVPTLPDQGVFP